MRAGFAKVNINPPIGTRMAGFGGRDRLSGCLSIHDDLFVRAAYLEHAGEKALVISYDLLFFSRPECDHFKARIGRFLDILPRQILLNTSHTHVGPALGTWGYNGFDCPPDTDYVELVARATADAARAAEATARDATVWVTSTTTSLPVSRRKLDADGIAQWAPDPNAETHKALPICVLKDARDIPIALFFSVSCHPSTTGGHVISADYPGVAISLINKHLGVDAASFLQGCGGDTKASVIADGNGGKSWRSGTHDDVFAAGKLVADAVIAALPSLKRVEPALMAATVEMNFPLEPVPTREEFQKIAQSDTEYDLRRMWAKRNIERINAGVALAPVAPVTMHAVKLGKGVRFLGLEGEPTAAWGKILESAAGDGLTFPLGYTNGQGLYLPVERQLPEHGYEVDSAFEYGFPAPLAKGFEAIAREAVATLKRRGAV